LTGGIQKVKLKQTITNYVLATHQNPDLSGLFSTNIKRYKAVSAQSTPALQV
jgi:hypothetical protein